MDKLTYSIPEAARVLGISTNLAYKLVREGRIPAIKLGDKRLVISKKELERFVEAGLVA